MSHRRYLILEFVIPLIVLLVVVVICSHLPQNVNGQIAYKRHLSDLRIQELRNMAQRFEHSINIEKYACDNYYDYVCSRNQPLYSILGSQPELNDLIELLTELQDYPQHFDAKQKLVDFFISCNVLKSLEQCYRESFEYFKPLFGYIVSHKYIDSSSHDHRNFLDVLDRFLLKAERTENFHHNPIHQKIKSLRDNFRSPRSFFQSLDLNQEYGALRIYRESYHHNLRNLEQHRKRNSSYENGVHRTMLDWSLYVFQSRNKPMSYYFPTLNTHLWMALYNSTERHREAKRLNVISECLKLPQFVNVLEEAKILALVYLKSFRMAWQDYRDWITSSRINEEIFDQENEVLKQYHLNNKRIFFTLYAQNFCDFGKELAESVFYLGLKRNQDFFAIYSCGYQTEQSTDCFE